MRILVIKLTSLGDIIHALPAISDAKKACPELTIDFLVDESFKEIPGWHSCIDTVLTVANRRWRKTFIQSISEINAKRKGLQQTSYDYVIDLQGLFKSAIWGKFAQGKQHGYDKRSIKEPLASLFYDQKYAVPKDVHAIERNRILLSKVLGYSYNIGQLDFGIDSLAGQFQEIESFNLPESSFWIFLHGTAWASKQLPKETWIELSRLVVESNRTVIMPWGSELERKRAKWISEQSGDESSVIVLPKLPLTELMRIINLAQGVVTVDSGLGHLAAALNKPTVAVYGPTNPDLIGIKGARCTHIHAKNVDKLISMNAAEKNKIKTNSAFDYSSVTSTKIFELMGKIIHQSN